MSTQEIKSEIHKSVDNLPESVLQDVLEFIKQAESHPINKLNLARNLRNILAEDSELLKRLAQ